MAILAVAASLARGQSRTPDVAGAPLAGRPLVGRPLVIFLPGRDHIDRAGDAPREYYDSFNKGLAQLRAQTGFGDLDVPDADRRVVDYGPIYAKDASPPTCRPRMSSADSVALAGLGASRAHLSGLMGDVAAIEKWVAMAAAQTALAGGTTGSPEVIRQAAVSVLLMANSTLASQIVQATYIADELERTVTNLRVAGRTKLADGVHVESSALLALRDELKDASRAIQAVTSQTTSLDDNTNPSADPTTRVKGVPEYSKATLQRTAATLAERSAAVASVMQAVDGEAGSLTADVISTKPPDWQEPPSLTVQWITATGDKLPGGPAVTAGFIADTRNYIGEWPYRCETDRVLLDSLFGAQRAERPIILVSHGIGSLIGYGTLFALDAGVANDNLMVQSFIALGSPLGAPEVMRPLMGGAWSFPAPATPGGSLTAEQPTRPYIYPSRIMNWVIVRADADPMAMLSPERVFDANYGRPFHVVLTHTSASDPHGIVGYLDNVDTARQIAAAWCRAFVGEAIATEPRGCRQLLQSMVGGGGPNPGPHQAS
jgi:hypothetical protein